MVRPKSKIRIIDLNTQIAEFSFPFPAKIFEEELSNAGIPYRILNRDSYEGGSGLCIFYIFNSDFEKAFSIKEKVEKENAISELNYMHPVKKFFPYIGLLLLVIYVLFKYLIDL